MSTPIFDYVERHRRRLRAEFWSLELRADWHPGWHGCLVRLEDEGITIPGSGFARSVERALEKACAEAIERLVYRHDARTTAALEGATSSSGMAVHVREGAARANARRELIERDAFLCHFIGGVPAEELLAPSPTPLVGTLRTHLAREGIALRLGQLRTPRSATAVLCMATGAAHHPRFGVGVGLGCSSSLAKAIDHAALECFGLIMSRRTRTLEAGLSVSQFLRDRPRDGDSQLAVSLHTDGLACVPVFFPRGRSARRRAPVTVPGRFSYRHVPIPRQLAGCPIMAIRCHNPALQRLFFGVTEETSLNLERLREFRRAAGRAASSPWNLHPHPLA